MRYFKHLGAAVVLASLVWPQDAVAQGALGLWRTQADNKGQRAIVQSVKCGSALCGTIIAVEDPSGARIKHKNIGVRLFWDMKAVGKGTYEGRAFVPAFGRDYGATMFVKGSEMRVKGCAGPVCKSQLWTRIK